MQTNVKNETGITKSNDRFLVAAEALRRSLAEKPQVHMIHVQHYPTYIEVFCLVDVKQTKGKIPLEKLEKFVLADFSMRDTRTDSDISLSIYIDENLKSICAAYIAAGREFLPL